MGRSAKAGAGAGAATFFCSSAGGAPADGRARRRPTERTKRMRGFMAGGFPSFEPSIGSERFRAAGPRHLEIGADRAERLLVEGHVLGESIEELLGVHGRREDTRQDADVAAARHDAPEVEDELGWVVDDVREVHVNAVCDRVVDRELKSLGLWGLGLGRLIGHGDTSHFLGTPLRKRHASIVEVMRRLAVLFCLPALLAASEPVPKLADIDRLWALRAEGSTGGRALSSPIDLTIDASRAVLAAEPESLEARWRLMRALYFKGEHTTDDPTAKRTLFDEGRTVAEQALAVLRRGAGREAHRNLAKATPVELVAYVQGNAAAGPASPPDTGNSVLHGLGVAFRGAEESPARRRGRVAQSRGPPVSRRSDMGLRAGPPGRGARDAAEDPRRGVGPRLSRGEPENAGGGRAAPEGLGRPVRE